MPLLMRLLSPLVGVVTGTDGDVATAISGIVISTVAFALALFVIHRETTVTHSRSIADRTVLVLSFLPFALTWQAVYTESLTLLFLAVLWAALRRGLVTTAVLSGVAVGATRSIGIPLGVGLLAVHLAWPLCRHRQVARADFGSAAAGAAALVSSAGVLVWLGRAGGGVGAQAQFGRARSWPWVPVWRDLTGVGGYQLGSITSLLAIAVGATYVFARNEPVEWRIAVGIMLLMHLVMARQFPAYTIGAARYLMPIFPVSVWLAGKSMSLSRPVLIGISVIGLSTALVCAHSAGQGAFNLG